MHLLKQKYNRNLLYVILLFTKDNILKCDGEKEQYYGFLIIRKNDNM